MASGTLKTFLLGTAGAALAMAATPASALRINLLDNGTVAGTQAAQGFAIAARYWESVLTNNATINITVGYSDLGPNVLGGTRTELQTYVPIQTYYNLLNANTTKSAIDTAAVSHLPAVNANGGVRVVVPDYLDPATQDGVTAGYGQRIAPTNAAIGNTIAISNSNYKALLNDNSGTSVVDADIQFSNTFAFDFDPTNGISAGSYDFIGVAVHEIGHALGFLSGVEDFDYVSGTGGFDVDDYWWGYAADLFRYSATDRLDWTYGTASYFSLDGGASAFLDGYWSTGSEKGDGWQASHWKEPAVSCGNFRGIMNPYICGGLVDQAEGLDLALLDAIGWNTNVNVTANPNYAFTTAQMYSAFATAIPEPGSWALMIGGFGMIGGLIRRRPSVSTTVRFA